MKIGEFSRSPIAPSKFFTKCDSCYTLRSRDLKGIKGSLAEDPLMID